MKRKITLSKRTENVVNDSSSVCIIIMFLKREELLLGPNKKSIKALLHKLKGLT